MLKLYKHSEIDFEKWDACILKSDKGKVYMMSWFLDIISPGWQGLIAAKHNRYNAIMPVLGKKKGWLQFHPHPPLAQQLGLVYAGSDEPEYLLEEALSLFKKKFVLFKYPFVNTLISLEKPKFYVERRRNYILKLNKDYKEIRGNYRRDRKMRLKQSEKMGLNFQFSSNPSKLLALFRSEVADKITGGVSDVTIGRLLMIAEQVINNRSGFIAEITNASKEVLSVALFLKFKDRLIYFTSATTGRGKSVHANTFLIDNVIKQHLNKSLILDFEGSHITSIADFYRSFGAESEFYYLLNYEKWFFKKWLQTQLWLYKIQGRLFNAHRCRSIS